MTQRFVEISTPSRLHFGFLSFGHPQQRQFGGVGVMLDAPRLSLRLVESSVFRATGPLAERVRAFARRWAESLDQQRLPRVHIRVLTVPDEHVGLGVGTQLGLAVSAGLNRLLGLPDDSLDVLARRVARGQRSSVGTYGFRYGGLIAENGKLADETLGQLVAHVQLPADWRFVLFRPTQLTGLAGRSEQQAFDRLPPVDDRVRDRLWRELVEGILPAAQRGDLRAFSDSVYRYGRQAGMCFAAYQGGPFANPTLASWVERARKLGVRGVGQSSWGPTLFGILPSEEAAVRFARGLRRSPGGDELDILMTGANVGGASLEDLPYEPARAAAHAPRSQRSAYKPAS
jgi:beta-RFAP synthase